MAGQNKTGQAGQGWTGQEKTGQDRVGKDRTGQDRTGQDRTGQDRTVHTQYTIELLVSTYELYSSGSQCIMEDAMRKGLLGWARAAAIMVASIPTSIRR
jgi:hypothetical protein